MSREEALKNARHRGSRPWMVLSIVLMAMLGYEFLVYLPQAKKEAHQTGKELGFQIGKEKGVAQAYNEQALADSIAGAKKAAAMAAQAQPKPVKKAPRKPIVQNFKAEGRALVLDEHGDPIPLK